MLNKAWLVIVLLSLSGCFNSNDNEGPENPPTNQPPGTQPDDNETEDPPTTGNQTPGNQTPMEEIPRGFELTNCTSHQGAFQVWPTAIAPGDTPPGWEPPTPIATTVFLTFIECERLSWGEFERPILMAVESHTKRGEVQNCIDQTSAITTDVLHRIWTDDTEVASYLTNTYGIPTGIATITKEDTEAESVGIRRWNLQPPGAEPSYLVFQKWNDDAGDQDIPLRWIWWNGTIFGFIDLHRTYTSMADTMISGGEMYPPTLNGQAGVQPWTGVADWYHSMDVDAEIFLWRDTGCNEPI